MYKILINEIPVIIIEGIPLLAANSGDDLNPVYSFLQKKEIQRAFQFVESGSHLKSLTIFGENAKRIKKNVFAEYTTIKAAGGFIYNAQKDVLMIFRRGVWDLPKGKIDVGEKKMAAAIREVREETGIEKVEIIKKLKKTYHTYTAASNQKILKVTHWYLMKSFEDTELIPQAEEDIELVQWVTPQQMQEKLKHTFATIQDVVDAGITAMYLS